MLVCGHSVQSAKPCGENCEVVDWKYELFVCKECSKSIRSIYANQLSKDEKNRITGALEALGPAPAVDIMLEHIMRHTPSAPLGWSLMIEHILKKKDGVKYGRRCSLLSKKHERDETEEE